MPQFRLQSQKTSGAVRNPNVSRFIAYGFALRSALLSRVDSLKPNQRRTIAVAVSLILHLMVLLLLLPSKTGFASIGTTGLGEVNGAGSAVTLVDVSELTPPMESKEVTQPPADEQAEAIEAPSEPEITDVADAVTEKPELAKAVEQRTKPEQRQEVDSDGQSLSDSLAEVTAGAFGQNGEAYTDLWNAIAPCWNRIANERTLPAKLTISFDVSGGLSAPPVIERDPDAEITDESLHAEAQALQALSECGAYPMAKDLQNVSVKFPPPRQHAVPVQPAPLTSLATRP